MLFRSELIIAKQRNGPTGTIKMQFTARYAQFHNLVEAGQQESHSPGSARLNPPGDAGGSGDDFDNDNIF